jgi:hypothetical protein
MFGSVRYRTVLNFVVFYGKVRYQVPLFGDIDTKRAQCKPVRVLFYAGLGYCMYFGLVFRAGMGGIMEEPRR